MKFSALKLRMFYYFANLESDERWMRRGPRCLVKAGYFGMQHLRNVKGPHLSPVRDIFRAITAWRESGRRLRRRAIRDAGWHFSYLGGVAAIQEKIQSTSDGWKLPADFKNAGTILSVSATGWPSAMDRFHNCICDLSTKVFQRISAPISSVTVTSSPTRRRLLACVTNQ